MKCSIKRPFADISEHIKKIISAIREDANKNVQYTVNINKADQNLWPSHMAGVYLSNVIADVSSSYKCENVCSTISVFSYSLLLISRFLPTIPMNKSVISEPVFMWLR